MSAFLPRKGGHYMKNKNHLLHTAFSVIILAVTLLLFMNQPIKADAAPNIGFVFLNAYSKTVNIGDEFYLLAVTSNGRKPTFTSSNSKIASVNTYGKITAKKAGTAKITVKIKNGEAVCTVKVTKTTIQLSDKNISLENGYTARLTSKTSNGHPVTYRSDKRSIATVDEKGYITAKKPGTAIITAKADQTTATCRVNVRKPTITLSKRSLSLYRRQQIRLSVKSTSRSAPKWKSNKKSIATVDEYGTVTAIKNGSATITVTIDGVSKSCEITVKKPTVKFEHDELILAVGRKKTVKVSVSSGNKPVFSSSNTCIATVNEHGVVTANDVGKAYIYAAEDGVKTRMRVIVK
jgi:Bacterial surface proteins containing Ig-like domains